MDGFLNKVAKQILADEIGLQSQCIIVPNRRTGLFLRKEIISRTDKTSWMPEIITISEIFSSASELNIAEDLLLINKLYLVFRQHTGSTESFDEFYYWGEIILSDFDDIDKYLANAEKLFSTIADLGEIDRNFSEYDEQELEIIKRFWTNVNNADLSVHKQRFLDLWSKMWLIYSDFKKSLVEANIAYQGMLYRQIAENPEKCQFDKNKYSVVGFNALNKCEKTVLRHLKSVKTTSFYWDYDEYYVKNEAQEAGRFLRDNLKLFGAEIIETESRFRDNKCTVEVQMSPSPVSQVKMIDGILNEWSKSFDFNPEKTAIVLGDENLLIPLMYSIPPFVGEYNVSMGFPLKNSASFGFVSHLVALRRNERKNQDKTLYYYKDILAIVNHTFVQKLFADDADAINTRINSEKLIYSFPPDFCNNEFLNAIFTERPVSTVEMLRWFTNVTKVLSSLLSANEEFAVENECMIKIFNRLNVIYDCIAVGEIDTTKKEILFKIILNSLRTMSLAFEGEPLTGMQVLGFLETRNLDFDKVIMISLNEGVFPKKSAAQSMIPYNLRKFYELPSIEFQDSIFAYYFYRLLQRAKDVKILYSAQSGDGSSEMSRFISQIKYESNLNITFKNVGYKVNLSAYQPVFASANEDTKSKVVEHLTKGISPKAINTFLNCQFKYYLQYIKGLKELDKTEEAEDSAFFGRLFHSIMMKIYEPLIGKVLNVDDFKNISSESNLNEMRLDAIREVFNLKNKTEIDAVNSKLIVDIVMKYVISMLNYDKESCPLTIRELEKTYAVPLQINCDQNSVPIAAFLKGNIDRVDLHNGIVRVIDYKTGSVKLDLKAISDLFSEDRKHDADIATQVFAYCLMHDDKGADVCPAVFNINELARDYDYHFVMEKNAIEVFSKELQQEFSDNLKALFVKMVNTHIFEQTQIHDNCKYCIYKGICER